MARTGFLLASAVLVSTIPTMAQTTATPPAGSTQTIPEKQNAKPLQDGRSENLSSKLSKTGGVITPQAGTDPQIRVPAPDPAPSSMPVIPPSATGGNTAK